MREIKFRAWSRLMRKMDYSPMLFRPNKDIDECFLNEWIRDAQEHMNGIVLMQFTGLHDKNGVPIWEGDILRITDGGTHPREGQTIQVFYEREQAGFYPFHGHYFQGKPFLEVNPSEVLGNVWENPELLEKK